MWVKESYKFGLHLLTDHERVQPLHNDPYRANRQETTDDTDWWNIGQDDLLNTMKTNSNVSKTKTELYYCKIAKSLQTYR